MISLSYLYVLEILFTTESNRFNPLPSQCTFICTFDLLTIINTQHSTLFDFLAMSSINWYKMFEFRMFLLSIYELKEGAKYFVTTQNHFSQRLMFMACNKIEAPHHLGF